MKRLFIGLFFLGCVLGAEAQLAGVWKGKLIQRSELMKVIKRDGQEFMVPDTFEVSYYFEMVLEQQGEVITGTALTVTEFSQAKVRVVGNYTDGQLRYHETTIVVEDTDARLLNSKVWCVLEGVLTASFENGLLYLRGKWDGSNKANKLNCIPGVIVLEKKLERA